MTTLHSTAGCEATLRILTALEGLGTPVELDLHPDGWFHGSFGRSGPLLEDGTLRLFEVNAILRHLARTAAAGGLWPADPASAARADAWMDFAVGSVRPVLRRLRDDPSARGELAQLLGVIDAELAEREWLAGPLSVADFSLLHLTMLPRFGVDVSGLPHLGGWMERIGARPELARARARAEQAAAEQRARAHPTLDALVRACRAAKGPEEIAAVLRDAVARKQEVLAAIGPVRELAAASLFRSPSLTVQWIAWPPGVASPPHDHRMWAVIGVLAGRENNSFFRRAGATLEPSGAVSIGEGEVAELPIDVIHSVENPFDGFSVALHVYGGDIVGEPRSAWSPMTGEEEALDGALLEIFMREFNALQRAEPEPFAAANARRIAGAAIGRARALAAGREPPDQPGPRARSHIEA